MVEILALFQLKCIIFCNRPIEHYHRPKTRFLSNIQSLFPFVLDDVTGPVERLGRAPRSATDGLNSNFSKPNVRENIRNNRFRYSILQCAGNIVVLQSWARNRLRTPLTSPPWVDCFPSNDSIMGQSVLKWTMRLLHYKTAHLSRQWHNKASRRKLTFARWIWPLASGQLLRQQEWLTRIKSSVSICCSVSSVKGRVALY